MFRNLRVYFKSDESKSIDSVDIIISWGFVLVSIPYIMLTVSSWDSSRYLNVLLPYGTILLCKNVKEFIKFVHFPSYRSIFVVGGLLILLAYDPDWGKHRDNNGFDDDLNNINCLIDEKGLHDGLGTEKVYAPVIASGNGTHWVYPISFDNDIESCVLSIKMDYTDCFFDYFIVAKENIDYADTSGVGGEQIEMLYGEPDEIIEFNYYDVWIYYEGIDNLTVIR